MTAEQEARLRSEPYAIRVLFGTEVLLNEVDRLRTELHAWENYWGPDVREKTSAELASLRAQVGVLSGLLNQLLHKKRDGLGEWWLVAEPSEELLDRCGAALSNPAIAERLEAERELREAIDDVISWFGAGLKRLKAAAERMWPSGKGEK